MDHTSKYVIAKNLIVRRTNMNEYEVKPELDSYIITELDSTSLAILFWFSLPHTFNEVFQLARQQYEIKEDEFFDSMAQFASNGLLVNAEDNVLQGKAPIDPIKLMGASVPPPGNLVPTPARLDENHIEQPLNLLICGSGYGVFYARAIQSSRNKYKIGGILGRGSQRSELLAKQLGVPFYRDVAQLPSNLSLACVAVSPEDTKSLVINLLKRGISVLVEHPMRHEDIKEALETAAKYNAVFHLNCHYGDLPAAKSYIEDASTMVTKNQPLLINIGCNQRTLYSALDIVGRIIKGTYQVLTDEGISIDKKGIGFKGQTGIEFVTVNFYWSNIPICVRCILSTNELDDGSDLVAFHHQILISFHAGTFFLMNAAGPIFFINNLTLPAIKDDTPFFVQKEVPLLCGPTGNQNTREKAILFALDRLAKQHYLGKFTHEQNREHLLGVSNAYQFISNHIFSLTQRV